MCLTPRQEPGNIIVADSVGHIVIVPHEYKFETQSILNYLNHAKGNGLRRLQSLSNLLNTGPFKDFDYDAENSVIKWTRENKPLFDSKALNLDDREKSRICGFDSLVYVNHYASKIEKEDHKELNEYCKTKYTDEQFTKAKRHRDGLAWFWLGEY